MARRKRTGEANEHPRLTVPRGQLEEELRGRIQKGEELLGRPILSDLVLGTVRGEYYTWTEYNEQLLRKRFTTSAIAEEYGRIGARVIGGPSTLAGEAKDLHEDVRAQIRRLESIIERLPLFDEPSSVSDEVGPHERGAREAREGTSVFVVHGHDEARKQEVVRLLSRLTSLGVLVLHEQPNRGRTIIEKFEEHAASAAFAVVILTGDDLGRPKANNDQEQRLQARQNVVFEMGFFAGVLGRSRVAVLYQQGVELPSDISGVLYTVLDDRGGWRSELARELRAAGIEIDPEALL